MTKVKSKMAAPTIYWCRGFSYLFFSNSFDIAYGERKHKLRTIYVGTPSLISKMRAVLTFIMFLLTFALR